MAVFQKYQGSPFLYDHTSGDIVGVKDPDGSEFFFDRAKAHGVFLSTETQTDGVASATAMTFNNQVLSESVRVEESSKIYVDKTALYNFQLSTHVHNSDSQAHTFEYWGKLNGVNIPNSLFPYSVQSSHGGQDGQMTPSQNFFLQLNAGDYVEVYWTTNNVAVSIVYTGPQSNPDRPAAPAILLTVNETSSVQ